LVTVDPRAVDELLVAQVLVVAPGNQPPGLYGHHLDEATVVLPLVDGFSDRSEIEIVASHASSFLPLVRLPRVERVAETVADVVDREHRQEDYRARNQRLMRIELKAVLRVVEHTPPGRH